MGISSTPVDDNNSVLVQMQIQLGEIKGILNTIVTEHARRLADQESNSRQMRLDLDAVKNEANKGIETLNDKLMQMAIKGQEDGAKHLTNLNEAITTNKNHIAEIRGDVTELKSHNSASWGKVMSVVAVLVSVAALIWQVTGK